MHCAQCGYEESKVIDSRSIEEGNSIRRRRECLRCQYRFTTYEKVEFTPIIVIKRNGNREHFDRDKLLNGILRSCEKRPVSLDVIEKLVDDLELELHNNMVREIESNKLGEIVMSKLKSLDEIAYVRFASVYRQFKDIEEFKQELNNL